MENEGNMGHTKKMFSNVRYYYTDIIVKGKPNTLNKH